MIRCPPPPSSRGLKLLHYETTDLCTETDLQAFQTWNKAGINLQELIAILSAYGLPNEIQARIFSYVPEACHGLLYTCNHYPELTRYYWTYLRPDRMTVYELLEHSHIPKVKSYISDLATYCRSNLHITGLNGKKLEKAQNMLFRYLTDIGLICVLCSTVWLSDTPGPRAPMEIQLHMPPKKQWPYHCVVHKGRQYTTKIKTLRGREDAIVLLCPGSVELRCSRLDEINQRFKLINNGLSDSSRPSEIDLNTDTELWTRRGQLLIRAMYHPHPPPAPRKRTCWIL
mgnify:CR=1 FL=1